MVVSGGGSAPTIFSVQLRNGIPRQPHEVLAARQACARMLGRVRCSARPQLLLAQLAERTAPLSVTGLTPLLAWHCSNQQLHQKVSFLAGHSCSLYATGAEAGQV